MNLNQTRDREVDKILEYHGCNSGDCPHEKQSECNRDLAKAGFDAAIDFLKTSAGEFDEKVGKRTCQKQCNEYRLTNQGCHGYDFGNVWRMATRWQHSQMSAQVALAESERNDDIVAYEEVMNEYRDKIKSLEAKLASAEKKLAKQGKITFDPTKIYGGDGSRSES